MKEPIRKILPILSCLLLLSCKQKFDKTMWIDGDGVYYTYRNDMVDDLLQNHRLVGLSYHQLTQLLGEPGGKD